MRRGRTGPVALAVALATVALVPLAIWALTSLSGDEGELLVGTGAGAAGGSAELIVALPDEDLNDPDTTGGSPSVVLACLDREEQVEFRVVQPFPFTDTDGGTEPPHAHQLVPGHQLRSIERCRLEGTAPELEGELTTAPVP